MVKPKYLEKYNVCEATYTDITSIEDTENLGLYDIKSIVYDATKIFNLYNTGEMLK